VVVSLATAPDPEEKTVGLTFGTLNDQQKEEQKHRFTKLDAILSVLLILIIAGILMYFTG